MAKPKSSAHPATDLPNEFTKHFDGLKRKKGATFKGPCGGEFSPELLQYMATVATAIARPNADADHLEPMVKFLLSDLPRSLKEGDAAYKNAAKCFTSTLAQAWQSGSLFPSHPEDYAEWFLLFLKGESSIVKEGSTGKENIEENGRLPRCKIRAAKTAGRPSREDIALCSELLLSGGIYGEPDRCGFMPWSAKNDCFIRQSEAKVNSAQFDELLLNKEKVVEYERMLAESRFPSEWEAVKHRFPEQIRSKKIFHRTLMRERKLQGDDIAKFDTEPNRFQAIFDLLCWKYCLWGVENDKPILMKPSVNLTPYGTQVFIPAYMSFDPRRDLDLGYIAELHRSRGILRQGESMSISRLESRVRAVRTAEADEEAKRGGLKGVSRLAKMREAGVGRIGESGVWEDGAVRKAGGFKPHQDDSPIEDSLIYRRAKKGRQIKAAKKGGSPVKQSG